MLISALRILVKNPIKAINILTIFFISHENDVKTFFN